MSILPYIKEKFDPTRPMGRKNFFWTNFVYRLVVIVLVLAYIVINPGWNTSSEAALLWLVLADAPCLLLAFRRARAAKIHFSYIYIAGVLSVIYPLVSSSGDLSTVSNLIAGYNVGLAVVLIINKNKVEPIMP